MKRFVLAVLAGGLIFSVFAAAPASGHDSRWLIHHGGGQGIVRDHLWVTVCDHDVDGHEVWVRYYRGIDRPENWHSTGRAPSGGCHREGSLGGMIVAYRVCISYEGCTAYKYHWDSHW